MENALLLSIPQLQYRALHHAVLGWLSGWNPRRVKVDLPLVAAFVAGVLWVRGHATCAAIAAGGAFSHDALNRLLVGVLLRPLLQAVALTIVDRRRGYLILDDVVIDKAGRCFVGIHWLHSPSLNRKGWAYNAVVLAWTDGFYTVPLSYRLWKPPRHKDKKTKKTSWDAFDGQTFYTKLALAAQLLTWAQRSGFAPTAVLFDAYYLSRDMVERLKGWGWHWVSRIKSNRWLKHARRNFQPSQWPALAAAGELPPLERGLRAALAGWGEVKLVAVKPRPGDDTRYLVGSNPAWDRAKVVRLYGYRWDIEVAFRDGKQLAGLGDCQCRTWRAQENHLALVFLAYAFLQHQAGKQEAAGQALARLHTQARLTRQGHLRPATVKPLRWSGIPKRQNRPHASLCASTA